MTATILAAGAERPAPRASIVIPVRDGEPLLPRALASVLGQTERGIEVVVVDDGSTDGTWDCVQAFANGDPRVQGVRMPRNVGAPAASNVGIAASRGEWVAILDHDDWYAVDRIERLTTFGDTGRFDLVVDNQHHWDEHAGVVSRTALPPGLSAAPLSLRILLENAQTGRSTFDYGMLKPVFRRDFVLQTGLRYVEDCPEGYDFHLLLDAFARGASVGLTAEPLYYYATPFGELSREHCRPDKLRRKLANYNKMRKHTERAAEAYAGLLDPADIRLLRGRARSIVAYSAYLEARAKGRELGAVAAAAALARAPSAWPFAARGIVRRLGALMHRPPQKVGPGGIAG